MAMTVHVDVVSAEEQIFSGIAEVVEEYTGLPTRVPRRPLFVTPLGIAMHDKVLET